MKIQSINSSMGWNSSKFSCEKNNVNYTPVNFEGTLTVKELKRYPLEKKLSHLFTNCSLGDLVAVGKNFDEVHRGLVRTISGFNDIIKRILFVKHGGLSVPLAFGMDNDEEWSCINIGDKKILVSTEDNTEELEPDDACTIDEGDVIINNNVNIPIGIFADYSDYMDDDEDMNLLINPVNYATSVYNLEDAQQEWIEKANEKALTSLGKKGAKIQNFKTKAEKLSFKDIGGMDETITTLKRNVLYPIKYPFAYKNVAVNKGILLYGKPGTGKTLLAEALAGESNAEFLKISGTDFESMYYGQTEEKWRNLFSEARNKQPAIIFIDEFDAVVKTRGQGVNNQHNDKTVNQILSLMSDLEKSDDNVFVIATTNKPETIDSAIMRSGRFGKHIEIPVPDKNGLKAIYNIHVRNKVVDPEFNSESFLEQCFKRQFTGADIKHVVNEAHTNSWIRNGIYEKMDAGTLTPEDMQEVLISKEDFDTALKEWDKTQKSKARKPIGYQQ